MLRRDEWTLIQEARERLGNTKLEWVKGHGNNVGNQKADQVAENSLEESDARQLVNVEKEQFVLVVNGRIMETNLRQLTKQIHRKARSLEVEKGSASYQEATQGKTQEQIETWKESIKLLKMKLNTNYKMEKLTKATYSKPT